MTSTQTARNVPSLPTPAEQIHSLTVELARHVVALQDAVRQRDEARAEVERLRAELARMSAVVDEARTWRHGVLASGEECSTYALACAVDALDERSGR